MTEMRLEVRRGILDTNQVRHISVANPHWCRTGVADAVPDVELEMVRTARGILAPQLAPVGLHERIDVWITMRHTTVLQIQRQVAELEAVGSVDRSEPKGSAIGCCAWKGSTTAASSANRATTREPTARKSRNARLCEEEDGRRAMITRRDADYGRPVIRVTRMSLLSGPPAGTSLTWPGKGP